jgi:hypothetical protein
MLWYQIFIAIGGSSSLTTGRDLVMAAGTRGVNRSAGDNKEKRE